MKKTYLLLLTLMAIIEPSMAGTILLEGNYQGRNIYVQNPFGSSGVGFCTYEVTVNGDVTTDEINSSAFEIDFANFQLEIGEKLVVKIKHKDDCLPKVLNPEVLKPKSTFEIQSIKINTNGVLNWSTTEEMGELPFIIEQFRWNKWVKVGEVQGKGNPQLNEYSFQITPHSGENQFRVKQVDYTSKPRYSKSVRYQSNIMEISYSPKKVAKELIFSAETLYEIYDSYGNIVKKGFDKIVDASNLKKGIYYLNFDNKMEKIVKK